MAKEKDSKVSEETRAKQSKKSETRTRAKGKFATEIVKSANPPVAKKATTVRAPKSPAVAPEVDLQALARLVASYTSADFAKYERDPLRLDELAHKGNSAVRKAVAENPLTNDNTLVYLCESESLEESVLTSMLLRKNLSLRVQRNIVRSPFMKNIHKSPWPANILTRPNLSEAVIDELIRETISGSHSLSSDGEMYLDYARNNPDDTSVILRELAKNPSTNADSLRTLMQCPNWSVRFNVALNPNTPIEYLNTLIQDRDTKVVGAAKQSLGRKIGWIKAAKAGILRGNIIFKHYSLGWEVSSPDGRPSIISW